MATTAEIVYGESVRAIEAQESALDGLRARTGTVLAAASLTTAFLGPQALARHQSVTIIGGTQTLQPVFNLGAWIAIVAFIAVAGFTIVILLPWTWDFATSVRILI